MTRRKMDGADPLRAITSGTGRMSGKTEALKALRERLTEPPFVVPEIPGTPKFTAIPPYDPELELPKIPMWVDEASMMIDKRAAIRRVVSMDISMDMVVRFVPAAADLQLWQTVISESGVWKWHVVMYTHAGESIPEIMILMEKCGFTVPYWEMVRPPIVATEYLTMDEIDIEGGEMELFLGILEVVRSNADFSMGMGEQLTRFLDAL